MTPSTRLEKAAEMVGEETVTLTEMEPSDAWIGKDEYDLREAIQRMRKHTTEQGILELFFDELSRERQTNGKAN